MNYTEAYEICCKKARLHFEKLSGKLFEPGECADGNYYANYPNTDFASDRWVWLSSMITGLAPLMYETIGDKSALKWAYRFKDEYHSKVYAPFTQTMHDLGFLYIPYSVHLYRLTGDTKHRDTALRAADELAKRFNARGGFIEAWSPMNDSDRELRMIVDCAMNVSLLYWAWNETKHCFYRDVADIHLNTTIKLLVRDDYSVAHAWFFNKNTALPEAEANACGYSNGSHWARGTAWLVYGLAIAYTYTKNEFYLETALNVAGKYLDSLLESPVPVWDFRLPEDKPAAVFKKFPDGVTPWDESNPGNTVYNVDTSAAAIMSCAFILINKIKPDAKLAEYADRALEVLIDEYLDTDLEKPAMLKRSNGKNVYAVYGDYYFMLALAMKLFGLTAPWANEQQED